MAQIKDFISAVELESTDLFPVSQGNKTRKATLEALKNFVVEEINAQVAKKMELYIGESLPAIADRKSNTLYFKITDRISSGNTENIKVSPTMGIKIV
ncbi:hypothetical protein [Clostridium beijerinckii]|uniref:hypothetical protein n=1 Tax=Clostridium beijerinckii TaxID=1520 RepID=UPI00080A4827|nr:hypothetical protein [Clostridium beijerinckii]OCB00391.1 hypothetical protein BGS1_15735 [Clostridium beijerinckii]